MIRVYAYKGKYGSGGDVHRAHVLAYRDGKIVASETGATLRDAVRALRSFLRTVR